MAFTAAANATQRVGNYAPGSIAARPRQFAGGVRRRDETPGQFTDRMDAGYMASAMQGGSNTPTRADNIAKARADGTFDAKRDAFNKANSGSFMDAAGNIGPKAPPPGVTAPAAVTTPTATKPPTTPTATPAAAAKKSYPATFDGKSKADFFGAAMQKYGPSADMPGIYNDLQPKDKRMTALGKAASIAQSPETANIMSKAKDSLAKPAKSMVAAATSPTPTPTPKGVPAPTFADRNAQERYNQAMAFLGPPSNRSSSPMTPAARPVMASAPAPAIPGKQQVANSAKGGARGFMAAVQTPGRAVTAPLQGAKMAGQAFGTSVNMAVGAAKDMASKAKNWWETGETNPKKKKSFAAAAMN